MRILGIETSCDETAVCLIEASGDLPQPNLKVLGDALYSQIKIHKEFGGVFPALAKRAHAQNIVHLFVQTLKEAGQYHEQSVQNLSAETREKIALILNREDNLSVELLKVAETITKPDIEAIAVTFGPGLEPALWVGVNFARALSVLWNIPIIPTNHMLGHIYATLLSNNSQNFSQDFFPAIALLISGGHTELVKLSNWTKTEIIGKTRDDAVGEAFDKVARIMNIPYPGGPEISRLAEEYRDKQPNQDYWKLPRPMLHSNDFDFSFSGLKTAVLYAVKKHGELSNDDKQSLAREFEDAVVEVLIKKTEKSLRSNGARSVVIGGGVSCNRAIRSAFQEFGQKENIKIILPDPKLSTDNAVMIAIAGYINLTTGTPTIHGTEELRAQGNLSL
jgi:N6-L-threonylcarbamoyladenine synthase